MDSQKLNDRLWLAEEHYNYHCSDVNKDTKAEVSINRFLNYFSVQETLNYLPLDSKQSHHSSHSSPY